MVSDTLSTPVASNSSSSKQSKLVTKDNGGPHCAVLKIDTDPSRPSNPPVGGAGTPHCAVSKLSAQPSAQIASALVANVDGSSIVQPSSSQPYQVVSQKSNSSEQTSLTYTANLISASSASLDASVIGIDLDSLVTPDLRSHINTTYLQDVKNTFISTPQKSHEKFEFLTPANYAKSNLASEKIKDLSDQNLESIEENLSKNKQSKKKTPKPKVKSNTNKTKVDEEKDPQLNSSDFEKRKKKKIKLKNEQEILKQAITKQKQVRLVAPKNLRKKNLVIQIQKKVQFKTRRIRTKINNNKSFSS